MTAFYRPPNRVFQCRPIIGPLLGLLFALLLAGCSTARLGYNNAPELGYWWLDSYLDFIGPGARQGSCDRIRYPFE